MLTSPQPCTSARTISLPFCSKIACVFISNIRLLRQFTPPLSFYQNTLYHVEWSRRTPETELYLLVYCNTCTERHAPRSCKEFFMIVVSVPTSMSLHILPRKYFALPWKRLLLLRTLEICWTGKYITANCCCFLDSSNVMLSAFCSRRLHSHFAFLAQTGTLIHSEHRNEIRNFPKWRLIGLNTNPLEGFVCCIYTSEDNHVSHPFTHQHSHKCRTWPKEYKCFCTSPFETKFHQILSKWKICNENINIIVPSLYHSREKLIYQCMHHQKFFFKCKQGGNSVL